MQKWNLKEKTLIRGCSSIRPSPSHKRCRKYTVPRLVVFPENHLLFGSSCPQYRAHHTSSHVFVCRDQFPPSLAPRPRHVRRSLQVDCCWYPCSLPSSSRQRNGLPKGAAAASEIVGNTFCCPLFEKRRREGETATTEVRGRNCRGLGSTLRSPLFVLLFPFLFRGSK